MTPTMMDPFEKIIRESGEDWLMDSFAPQERATGFLRETLRRADARAKEILGVAAPSLTAEAIIEEYGRNAHKVRAFLQVLGATQSPDMLLMVWRILQGMEIAAVRMEYRLKQQFSFQVQLASSDVAQGTEIYESSDIDDAVVLRHFGIMKMNDLPVFDGFYALKIR